MGVTMMVVGSLVSLMAKPELFTNAFKSLRQRSGPAPAAVAVDDPLAHIELPLWMSFVGVPIFSVLGAWVTHEFFGVPWLLAFISLPLIFVLTVICTNSMALTSWTPTGSLSKITQFTMGAIDRTNPASNLIPAGMTAEETHATGRLIRELSAELHLAAIIIEHDIKFIRDLDAPITVLHLGKVFSEGSYDEISADAHVRNIYLGTE